MNNQNGKTIGDVISDAGAGIALLAVAAVGIPLYVAANIIFVPPIFLLDKFNENAKNRDSAIAESTAKAVINDALENQNISIPQNPYVDCLINQATKGYAQALVGNRYSAGEEILLYRRTHQRDDLKVSDVRSDQSTFSESISDSSFNECANLNSASVNQDSADKVKDGLKTLFMKVTFSSVDEFNYSLTYLTPEHARSVSMDRMIFRIDSLMKENYISDNDASKIIVSLENYARGEGNIDIVPTSWLENGQQSWLSIEHVDTSLLNTIKNEFAL